MVIEAGRAYRIVDAEGVEHIRGVARFVSSDVMELNGYLCSVGGFTGMKGWRVELVEDELPNAGDAIDVAAVPHPEETTEERHAADAADLGGNLPRLDPRRLELRRLHALERVADALELLVGAAFEGVESLAGEPDEETEQ